VFINHLKKQAKKTRKIILPNAVLENKIDSLNAIKNESISQNELNLTLMRTIDVVNVCFRLTAEKMINSYTLDKGSSELLSKAVSYGKLAQEVSPIRAKSPIAKTPMIATLMLGRINNRVDWTLYAKSFLSSFRQSELSNNVKYFAQFPMIDFIFDDAPNEAKARAFVKDTYNIDSRADPEVTYNALVADHIKYTKLFKDVYTSVYASEPLNFLPLEILYLSLFIEMPMDKELFAVRDRLCNLPDVKDEGIEVLEEYIKNRAA